MRRDARRGAAFGAARRGRCGVHGTWERGRARAWEACICEFGRWAAGMGQVGGGGGWWGKTLGIAGEEEVVRRCGESSVGHGEGVCQVEW